MLPNSESAWIPAEKISKYLLSVTHTVGRYKAQFFQAHGYYLGNAAILRRDLMRVAQSGDVIKSERSPYGVKYVVEGTLATPRGTNIVVRTVWILEHDNRPRFVTAYPV